MTWIGRDSLGRITDFSAETTETDSDMPPNIIVSGDGSAVEQTVLSQTVTLNRAQIRALPSTPVQIVAPTQVSGYSTPLTTLPMVLGGAIGIRHSAGAAFTNVDDAVNVVVVWGADWSIAAAAASVAGAAPSASIKAVLTNASAVNSQFPIGILDVSGDYGLDDFQDNGLYVAMENGVAGALTGGHANDQLLVTVVYTVIDL